MGGDGGVIAVKRKFIKECKTEDKNEGRDVKDVLYMKATTCALSGQELNEPIACCKLGYLFNKEAIISSLLEKNLPNQFHHITGLKTIKTLIFSNNSEQKNNSNNNNNNNVFKFVCPITLLPFNGIHPFVVIWSTGYVISEKAIRELGYERLQDEYGPFTENDIVRLLPNDEELVQRRALIEAQQEIAQRKSSKKKRERENQKESITNNEKVDNLELNLNNDNLQNHPNKKSCDSISLSTQQVLDHAQSKIQNQEEKSQIYQNLFHKDSDKKVTDRDLFIAVSGLRYTLS